MKYSFTILLLTTLFLLPINAHARIIDGIAAIVNDEIITLQDLYHEAKAKIIDAEKSGKIDKNERTKIHQTVLDRLVEKRLVDQKVKELGIRVGEDEVRQAIEDVRKQNNMPDQSTLVAALAQQGISFDEYRMQLQEQLEKLRLVSQEVRAKIQVGEQEIRDFYAANPSSFSEEETFRARHIFFRIDEKAPSAEIKRAMSNVLMVLAEAKSGKDFSELAKKYSEDPAAKKDGGDLGQFKKGDMLPELESAITAMKPGEVSELVKTPTGLHIVKLEQRSKGKLKDFESVKSQIEDLIYRKKSDERFSAWTKELRTKASIEVKDLNGLF